MIMKARVIKLNLAKIKGLQQPAVTAKNYILCLGDILEESKELANIKES